MDLAYKLEAVKGRKIGTEKYYRLLSRPFCDEPLGLADITHLMCDVVYPTAAAIEELTDEQLEDVTSYIGSGTYERLCGSWSSSGKTFDDIVFSFKGWCERRATTAYP
jgi:hypothetical protein